MRIGGLSSGPSRREVRREKEQDTDRSATRLGMPPRPKEKRIKPAVRKQGERKLDQVALPLDPVVDPTYTGFGDLPKQKALVKTNIRPQHLVDIIMPRTGEEDSLDVRNSIILEVDKQKRLYLAQTSPPILRSHTGQTVELTFLSRYGGMTEGRWQRVGYHTPILEVILDHVVDKNRGITDNVIMVDGPKALQPATLRLDYRLVPPDELDLRLVIWPDNTEVGLMNISASGAKFYHDSRWYFPMRSRMTLALKSGRVVVAFDAEVVRTGRVRDRFGHTQGFTSVRFDYMRPDTRHKFMQLLNETYRYLLVKRSGVAPRRPR